MHQPDIPSFFSSIPRDGKKRLQQATAHAAISLLHCHPGFYTNGYEVNFDLHDDQSLIVTCSYPDYHPQGDHTSLDLFGQYEQAADFFRLFSTGSAQDLENIGPVDLLKSYEKGQAEVICMIDCNPYRCYLAFRKQGTRLFVRDKESDQEQELPIALTAANDFVDFGTRYAHQGWQAP